MLVFALETKKCMSELLLSSTFDSFLFIEGEIITFNKFTLDGYLEKEFYDSDVLELIQDREYSLWKDMRDFCFSIIKGKRTPLRFKLIFSLSKSNIAKLLQQEGLSFSLQDVQGLYLNFRYDGEHLHCTTGTSMNTFTMDKSLDHAWDAMVQRFLKQKEIGFELLS